MIVQDILVSFVEHADHTENTFGNFGYERSHSCALFQLEQF